jgi:membrane-bound lytic murein transglycosylase F
MTTEGVARRFPAPLDEALDAHRQPACTGRRGMQPAARSPLPVRRRAPGLVVLALSCLALVAACAPEGGGAAAAAAAPAPAVDRDLAHIAEDGKLRVLFTYNSTGYFVYRGEVMGLEFRLLRAFAEDQGLELEPVVVRDRRELVRRLAAGEGDVIAARLLDREAAHHQGAVLATRPLYVTPPTLVQEIRGMDDPQLPEPIEELIEEHEEEVTEVAEPEREEDRELRHAPETVRELRARMVTRPAQLAGKTVHLDRGSSYVHHLVELRDRLSGDIRVVELERSPNPESAIEEVAEGTPRYTVAPENLAELQEEYYVNIEVLPVLGEPDRVVWAVRRGSPALHRALDGWLAANPERVTKEYRTYFEDREGFRERVESRYLTSATGRLSRYDAMIKQAAADLDWDWRLLASQAYQESRFDPDARSWAGAVGILQIMPATAREVGVERLRDPEENLAGAVRYLRKLDAYWRRHLPEVSPEERLRFVLASYNAGMGHVQDARRLAAKHGADDESWEEVAYWLLRLSETAVYNDPVVKYGFVRGLEPVTYVALINERYRHYLDFVEPEVPAKQMPRTGARTPMAAVRPA